MLHKQNKTKRESWLEESGKYWTQKLSMKNNGKRNIEDGFSFDISDWANFTSTIETAQNTLKNNLIIFMWFTFTVAHKVWNEYQSIDWIVSSNDGTRKLWIFIEATLREMQSFSEHNWQMHTQNNRGKECSLIVLAQRSSTEFYQFIVWHFGCSLCIARSKS